MVGVIQFKILFLFQFGIFMMIPISLNDCILVKPHVNNLNVSHEVLLGSICVLYKLINFLKN